MVTRTCPKCKNSEGFTVTCIGQREWEKISRQYVPICNTVTDTENDNSVSIKDDKFDVGELYESDYGYYYVAEYEGGFDDGFKNGPEDSWEADELVIKEVLCKCVCGFESLAEVFDPDPTKLKELDLSKDYITIISKHDWDQKLYKYKDIKVKFFVDKPIMDYVKNKQEEVDTLS
jgi:hypothetical protein